MISASAETTSTGSIRFVKSNSTNRAAVLPSAIDDDRRVVGRLLAHRDELIDVGVTAAACASAAASWGWGVVIGIANAVD